MNDPQRHKEAVGSRHAQRAQESQKDGARCCGSDAITRGMYAPQETSFLPADVTALSLGCDNPTALAELCPGEVALDLGSGAGLDVPLSAHQWVPQARLTAWT